MPHWSSPSPSQTGNKGWVPHETCIQERVPQCSWDSAMTGGGVSVPLWITPVSMRSHSEWENQQSTNRHTGEENNKCRGHDHHQTKQGQNHEPRLKLVSLTMFWGLKNQSPDPEMTLMWVKHPPFTLGEERYSEGAAAPQQIHESGEKLGKPPAEVCPHRGTPLVPMTESWGSNTRGQNCKAQKQYMGQTLEWDATIMNEESWIPVITWVLSKGDCQLHHRKCHNKGPWGTMPHSYLTRGPRWGWTGYLPQSYF